MNHSQDYHDHMDDPGPHEPARSEVAAEAPGSEPSTESLLRHMVQQLTAILIEAGAPEEPGNAHVMQAWAESVRADKARLDWLEERDACLDSDEWCGDGPSIWVCSFLHAGTRIDCDNVSPRAAIDSAMRAQNK